MGMSLEPLNGTATQQVCTRMALSSGDRAFGMFYQLQSEGSSLTTGIVARELPPGMAPDKNDSTFHLRWQKKSGVAEVANPRVEITPSHEYAPSGVRWYAVSVYLPSDWMPIPDTALFQLHTKQRGASPPPIVVPPPLALIAHNAQLRLHLRSSTRDTTGSEPPTSDNVEMQSMPLGALEKQKWYCLIVRADWQSAVGTGNLTVWLNGKRRYDARNVHNHYVNAESYPKAGMYMPGTRSDASQHVYVSPIHIGDEAATYQIMEAVTKCEHNPDEPGWEAAEQ
jgi:hypothetical protein